MNALNLANELANDLATRPLTEEEALAAMSLMDAATLALARAQSRREVGPLKRGNDSSGLQSASESDDYRPYTPGRNRLDRIHRGR